MTSSSAAVRAGVIPSRAGNADDLCPRRRRFGSLITSLWALYLLTFRQHLHGRRWMVLGLLLLLPALLTVVIRLLAPDAPRSVTELWMVFMFIPQVLLPLVALVYAAGIITDEQEEQTLTYLLIRPIPRWAIYVTKMATVMTTTGLLTIVFTAVTFVAVHVGGDLGLSDGLARFARVAGLHVLAVVAYGSLFGLISLLTRRSLVASVIYAVVFEGLLANLEFNIRYLTVIYYTRLLACRLIEFEPVQVRGQTTNIAAQLWQLGTNANLPQHPTVVQATLVLGLVALVSTILGAILVARREFHVKTPEGV
ncbi:MAG: ABC transporter permease [Gemmataceae bacterium]|nr:ABC transporter permease [Gemmataceae bacterium]